MNLENICEGLIVKNYKEMCEVLEEPIKTGGAKISQIEMWSNYIEFEKNGHKFIINKILNDVPVIINSKLKTIEKNIENGKYSKDVYPMVKNFVGKNDMEYISKSKLLSKLGFINENYNIAYLYPKDFTQFICKKYQVDISVDLVNAIVNSIYNISHDKIHKAFVNLEKLGYIFSYDNKLLMIYNAETHRMEMPTTDEVVILDDCIYEGKIKALSNYYARAGKSMDSYIELMNVIKEDCNDNTNKMSKKLNIELFLRGLSKEAHDIALKEIKCIDKFEYIKNFFYVYGYIKNEDIEWDKEIIDIAKENIHLNNYKEQVKNMFMLDTFLDKWFETPLKTNDNSVKKYKFKEALRKHNHNTINIMNILFETLTSQNTDIQNIINIKHYIKNNDENVSIESESSEELLELPF